MFRRVFHTCPIQVRNLLRYLKSFLSRMNYMTSDLPIEFRDLLTDVESLKASMLISMNGATPDHSRWVTFKSAATEYNEIAARYSKLTDQTIETINVQALKSSGDTIWPMQKEVFELTYRLVLKLHGRISNRLSAGIQPTGIDALLHPDIRAASMALYQAGDFRNAVLDGILAISDKIRELTKLDLDGDRLVTKTFSINEPYLILSEIESESGRNDQVGFMEIFKGVYRGVRNPKAHTLNHDLNYEKAGQYLVMLSLLMRRITEANLVPRD